MSKTKVVNLCTGDRFDQYIGRAGMGQDGYFGNPFKIGHGASRGSTLNRFRSYFFERLKKDPEFKQRVHALKGKTLGCFCKPHDCHGDVIAYYLDNLQDDETNT